MKFFHFCAVTFRPTGAATYADGCYRLEGDTLEIEEIRKMAASAMGEDVEPKNVTIVSLSRLDS